MKLFISQKPFQEIHGHRAAAMMVYWKSASKEATLMGLSEAVNS